MGVGSSSDGGGGGGGDVASAKQRELAASARDIWARIGRGSDMPEINLFFMGAGGTDALDCARDIAGAFGSHMCLAAPPEHAQDVWADSQRIIDEASRSGMLHREGTVAFRWLLARHTQHMLLALPSADPTPVARQLSGATPCRIFLQNPVEDHLVHMAMLRGIIDEHTDAVGGSAVLKQCMDVAWQALAARCYVPCSAWIYLRLADDRWRDVVEAHRRAGISPDIIDYWQRHRAALDRFFYHDRFRLNYHTLVIEVHHDTCTAPVVRYDIASIVGEFILRQHAAGAWQAGIDTATLSAHVGQREYQAARICGALQQSVVDTLRPAAAAALQSQPTGVARQTLPDGRSE